VATTKDTENRIHRLSPVLANQIAAGEVVERPASVVKELVENSIDAGARRVRIDVADGGIGLIRVTDDGHGMSRDDLALCLARHATSKLEVFEDLDRVATLGFRGEALPSIASVARLRVVSRTAQMPCAYEVDVQGDAFDGEPQVAEGIVGTRIEVRDLFFNTPARRRFLRTPRTEYLHVEEAVRRLALASSAVTVELWRDGRRQLHAPAADVADGRARLAALCGKKFAASATAFDSSSENLRCYGWVSAQGEERAHADVAHLCVNGRAVRDPLLRHAVRAAVELAEAGGRHVGHVVYLELPAIDLDVNVHPTKHEVRFHRSRQVHDFVSSTVRHALDGEQLDIPDAAEHAGISPYGPAALRSASDADDEHHPGDPARGEQPRQSLGGESRGRSTAQSGHRASASAYSAMARRGGDMGRGVADASSDQLTRLTAEFCMRENDSGDWELVSLAALSYAVVLDDLEARLRGEARPTSPLLVPAAHRGEAALLDRLEHQFSELAAVGFEVRRTADDECVLIERPLCLDHLEVDLLWPALVGFADAKPAEPDPRFAALASVARDEARVLSLSRIRQWLMRLDQGDGHLRVIDDQVLRRAFGASH
jgi:DNA mismatch repair protein MutL